MARFVLFDENFLVYGARVLVSGMDIDEFKLNPIMLFNHHRTWRGTKDEMLPIGKWENIETDETKLYATDYYDKKDEFAQQIKNKVEQGILNMASVTLMVIATSDDPSVLVQGQTRPTIIQCKVVEGSIVDIGRNKGAYKMTLRKIDGEGNEIDMPVFVHLIDENGKSINMMEDNHLLPLLQNKIESSEDIPPETDPENSNIKSDMNKEERKQLTLSLGLKDDATDAEILQAQKDQTEELRQLRSNNGLNQEETQELEQFRNNKAAAEKAAREKVVNDAISARKIVAADKEKYLKLMEKAPEITKELLENMQPVQELNPDNGGQNNSVNDIWEARFKEIDDDLKNK